MNNVKPTAKKNYQNNKNGKKFNKPNNTKFKKNQNRNKNNKIKDLRGFGPRRPNPDIRNDTFTINDHYIILMHVASIEPFTDNENNETLIIHFNTNSQPLTIKFKNAEERDFWMRKMKRSIERRLKFIENKENNSAN